MGSREQRMGWGEGDSENESGTQEGRNGLEQGGQSRNMGLKMVKISQKMTKNQKIRLLGAFWGENRLKRPQAASFCMGEAAVQGSLTPTR